MAPVIRVQVPSLTKIIFLSGVNLTFSSVASYKKSELALLTEVLIFGIHVSALFIKILGYSQVGKAAGFGPVYRGFESL